MSSKSTAAVANALWQKEPKANAEFFALTYGALVSEVVRDLEQTDKIQAELDRMGHSMGIRSIEEVLAKADTPRPAGSPNSFLETAELIKIAFRMFLGVAVDIVSPASSLEPAHSTTTAATITTTTSNNPTSSTALVPATTSVSYGVKFTDNPLTIFVELPPDRQDLEYSQLLAGWCRGMLEMLQFECKCVVVRSPLMMKSHSGSAGGSSTPSSDHEGVYEIAVILQQVLQEGAGEDYQEE